jgi:hypothetical protein
MGNTIWDALVAIISFSISILFWPLGLAIKYWDFFATVVPYLILGAIACVVGTSALGMLLFVLRGVFAVVRGIFGALMAVVAVFRNTRKEQNAQEATEEEQADDSTDPNDPYHILGVKRGVTSSELNARYRQLLRVNHPDKVAQLDPEIQAFASERARRIIEAYKVLVPEA